MLTKARRTRKTRIRPRVRGTADRPRLSVFRSNKLIYAQLIDDAKGSTLAQAKGAPVEVGEAIAAAAKKKKIERIVFDRSGYKYHGKVKALAEAAREKGLIF